MSTEQISEKKRNSILLPVTGMSCAACASSVESMLQATTGVEKANVNFASGMVDISFNPNQASLQDLRESIRSIGYDLIIEDEEEKKQAALAQAKSSEYRKLVRKTVISLLFTLPIMVISMGFPEMPKANTIMLLLTLPVIFWSGRAFYQRAILQLQHRMVSMDTLVSLSTAIAFLFSLFVTVFPEYFEARGFASHVYFEASAVIISFVLLGKLLEERAKSHTSSAIKKLMKLQPEFVDIVFDDGQTQSIPVSQIKPGFKVIVKPGDQVPIDGKVIDGNSSVDESMITGEPLPVYKEVSSSVFAGTINHQGKLLVEATTTGSETMLAKIIQMVQKAQGSKAEVQKLADKIAGVFVPVVLGIALLTFVLWLWLGGEHNLTYALITSISVLVIACPCALGLATPTAIMVGLGRGAEHNVLIKDATALETLTRVTAVVFDKTGTLTEGKPQVSAVYWHETSAHSTDQRKHAQIIYRLESYSEHPLAEAIKSHFADHNTEIKVTAFTNIPGKGIVAELDGQQLLLGNIALMKEHQVKSAPDGYNPEGTQVYFAIDKRHIATIQLADQLRKGAAETVTALQKAGMQTFLLTGDNAATAEAISQDTGIATFRAGLLPHEKAEYIKQLKANGHTVAMIGDGINDSEALALADVGIAMGSGSDIALEVAEITLKSNDISLIEKAVALSTQTTKTIKQNLFWAFVYNLVGIPIAAGVLYTFNGFLLNPMIAAGAMALSSVSVVTNSLLLKRRSLTLKPRKRRVKNISKMHTFKFKTNINCNGCIAAVTPKLETVSEIKAWQVDTENPDKILTVELDNSNYELVTKAVKDAGYNIEKI